MIQSGPFITFNQHNRLTRQKISTCFLMAASGLWRLSFVVRVSVNHMCFIRYDSATE